MGHGKEMGAVSCSDTPRSCGWMRWKADNLLVNFKKNPDEKYFFIMENFHFEKKKSKILKISIFFCQKVDFSKGSADL